MRVHPANIQGDPLGLVLNDSTMMLLTDREPGAWHRTVVFVAPLVILATVACSSTEEDPSRTGLAAPARPDAEARADGAPSQIPIPTPTATTDKPMPTTESTPVYTTLPRRSGPLPLTTGSVPHAQIDVTPVPEVKDQLFLRAFALPDVENRPTIVSLPGTRGVWIREGVSLAHPEAIVAGREFTHIHPDGSLHAPLSSERAIEAVDAGWAERHPWADQREGWEGLVLLYTPRSLQELDVVFQLIVESYNFVTGRDVKPSDI